MHDLAADPSLDLNAGWAFRRVGGSERLTVDFPTDLHTALLANGMIEDPYWRDRETALDWIHASEWWASRTVTLATTGPRRRHLVLEDVDCHVVVIVNGRALDVLGNRFRRHRLDVTDALVEGENMLELRFLSNSAVARAKSKAAPFPIPHIAWNNRLPHYNFLRKPQCDAGWDWNIALSPLGVYGGITLETPGPAVLDDLRVTQRHDEGGVTVSVHLYSTVFEPAKTTATLTIDGQTVTQAVTLWPGTQVTRLEARIEDPRLWWPTGHGPQEMYDLTVAFGNETRTLRIGLRDIALNTDPDDVGQRFALSVNGREIFMRGANWIPADALPARATPDRVADLLDSAIDANMTMLRVWGGGTYEPDWFYDLCSERGLLVWQDFMFACNLYPAQDRDWLNDVREEARQQVRRLSRHACLALWCGDNELVGALGWFDESRADRDRYLALYDRLNHALEDIVFEEAPDTPWWPSSPSVGPLNFGDGWHDDTAGDMHFWDVWHSAKDFEHYRSVRPRFCSEFGFQSFPSPALIRTFTDPGDRNVSSPVMDVHQRNPGGNSRIVETLARYFRFPETFDDMCWLSQVSQGLAMKTAIEFWRSCKPRCMGTLYWQLNDTWPVASWSSLEYGGAWKLMHAMARRFYAPVLVTAQRDPDTGDIVLWAVNDRPQPLGLHVSAEVVDVAGPVTALRDWSCQCPASRAVAVGRVPASEVGPSAFLHFRWSDLAGTPLGDNDYLPQRPKAYALRPPQISAQRDGARVTLTSDVPALFVTYSHGGREVWSDNAVTLLPGRPRVLSLLRDRPGRPGDHAVRWLAG